VEQCEFPPVFSGYFLAKALVAPHFWRQNDSCMPGRQSVRSSAWNDGGT
jgi:hypothetical protein